MKNGLSDFIRDGFILGLDPAKDLIANPRHRKFLFTERYSVLQRSFEVFFFKGKFD